MTRLKVRWLAFVAAFFLLLTFQNCEGLQSTDTGSDSRSANANGDGYSGIVTDHPEVVESGSTFSIRIKFFFVDGLDFELIEGQATIRPIPGTHRALITVDEDYVGSLVIQVTNRAGQSTVIEVQVIAPEDITNGTHNQSFGKHMVLSGKRIVAGVPLANVGDALNQGKVHVFNHKPDTGEFIFHQKIENPEVNSEKEVRFGTSLDGYLTKDLLVGAPNDNKVHYFRSVEQNDKVRYRYELVETFENPAGGSFGSSVIVNARRMLIGEKGADGTPGEGKVYIHTRDSDVDTDFTFSHQIDSPVNVKHFGRHIGKVGKLTLVSGVRIRDNDIPQHGIVLVYDTMSGDLVQTIEKVDVSPDYGNQFHLKGDYLFLGTSFAAEVDGDREFVDILKLNTTTGLFEDVQRLVNPEGVEAQTLFSDAMAFNGDRLFVGAPKADSPTQTESGVVYIYRLNSGNGLFERTGLITPNFEMFDFVRNMGRSIVCDNEHVFISLRGLHKDANLMKGDLFAIPLE